ncbi:MAG TPA: hypothetical protein VK527_11240 [Candidatus Limnocylindrales bacterium]|nr:hypothetical protein [Candidatus Limnocylindrales bacterium]
MSSEHKLVQGGTITGRLGPVLALALALGMAGRGECASIGPVNFQGHLDLVGASRNDQNGINNLNFGENPFHTARIRLFADAPIQEHVHVFTEFLYDDDAMFARLFGGFVRLSDPKGRDIHLEVGKIPLHLGAYPNRAYAPKNNLIGAPLMYQYHTNVRNDQVPTRGDDIVANQGLGYRSNYMTPGLAGVGYDNGWALPILYENCWDFGAVVIGTLSPLEFAVGATNGTAGAPLMSDYNDGKQVLARIGFAPTPWLRAGVSGSRGPYLMETLNEDLPPGRTADDYMQKLASADLELSYGHGVLYSEFLRNWFESPFIGDLELSAWYVEGKYTVLPGWYVAARFDRMVFDDVSLSTGGVAAWDADLWKREIGIGFKPSTRLVAKLVHQESRINVSPPIVRAFAAAQLSVVF